MAFKLVPNRARLIANAANRKEAPMKGLVPNTDRLSAEKETPRDVFEARAFAILHEMDQSYFHGAAHVTAVKLAHFEHDYRRDGAMITLGCFNPLTNVVYLNRHIKSLVDMGQHIEDFQAVLWHELIHAVLMNAHQQFRHGKYKPCGGDHGEDFWKLADQHPSLGPLLHGGAIERMSERIYFRMSLEGRIKNAAKREVDAGDFFDILRQLFGDAPADDTTVPDPAGTVSGDGEGI